MKLRHRINQYPCGTKCTRKIDWLRISVPYHAAGSKKDKNYRDRCESQMNEALIPEDVEQDRHLLKADIRLYRSLCARRHRMPIQTATFMHVYPTFARFRRFAAKGRVSDRIGQG
jgi:hypothetical protein